jgi:hypothetical protein
VVFVVTAKTQYNLKNAKEYFEEHLCVGDYYNEGQRVAGKWMGLWDRLHGYLLRFGQHAADTFCRLKQSRRHTQPGQKHEHQITRMLHH